MGSAAVIDEDEEYVVGIATHESCGEYMMMSGIDVPQSDSGMIEGKQLHEIKIYFSVGDVKGNSIRKTSRTE